MRKLLLPVIFLITLSGTARAVNDLGILQESIGVGKILSIGLNEGSWTIASNSNPAAASARIGSNALIVVGNAAGTSSIVACNDAAQAHCMNVTVSVQQVLGASIAAPHAAGTWIIQAGTIYFVSQNGLIPVSTWKIFVSNKGKIKQVQPANDGDMGLKVLPLMKAKDSRVK